MNKKAICILIAVTATATSVSYAETTLYGRIRNALVYTDYDNPENGSQEADWDEQWDVQNHSSRIGVKGSEDLGEGLKAIYQWEAEIETAEGGSTYDGGFKQRLGFVGLSGGWGTAAIGRQWTPYYNSVHKTDIWQLSGMDDWYLGETREGNIITYASPDFSGFSGKLATITTDESQGDIDGGEDGVDWWNASLDYQNGPLSIGTSYMKYRGDDDYYQAGIGAKYVFNDMFGVIAQYEKMDSTSIDGVDLDMSSYAIQGEYYFGNNTLRAMYGSVKDSDDIDKDFSTWALGLEHSFSKRTRVYAEYQDTEHDKDTPTGWADWYNSGQPDEEQKKFGVGIRHDF